MSLFLITNGCEKEVVECDSIDECVKNIPAIVSFQIMLTSNSTTGIGELYDLAFPAGSLSIRKIPDDQVHLFQATRTLPNAADKDPVIEFEDGTLLWKGVNLNGKMFGVYRRHDDGAVSVSTMTELEDLGDVTLKNEQLAREWLLTVANLIKTHERLTGYKIGRG